MPPVNIPIGSAWRDMLAQGRAAAQGLPGTVQTGLDYLYQNRGAGLPWNLAQKAAGEIGLSTESVPGTSIPNIRLGGRQPTVGTRGLNPPGPSPLTPPPQVAPMQTPGPVPLGGDRGPSGGGGNFLSEAGPGMWKVDRLGRSPMYTNQMDVANQEAGQESGYRAGIQRAMPGPPSLDDLDVDNSIRMSPTQTAPSLPSPSPAEGAEDIKVKEGRGRGFDWGAAGKAIGEIYPQIARGVNRPGNERPYAQMGYDEQMSEQDNRALAQQKLQLDEQQGQDRIAAMDREIAARMQMGQQEAAQRLTAMREEMIARSEMQRQEMEARYGGQLSPEIAAAMGVPPGTSMREAELLAKVKEAQAEAAQRAAYQKYLEQQGGNLTSDNQRQGIEARLRAIQANPVYAYSPEGQHEMAELSKQLTPGVQTSPFVPPPAAPAPPQEPGLWEGAKNWLGFGDQGQGAEAITKGPALGGQGGPMAGPVGPPPLPPEVLQTIAPLPKQARTIVEGILRDHMNDPQGMKTALRQVIDKAPPEDREIVIKVLGPIVARF